jgi:hypothetical protein
MKTRFFLLLSLFILLISKAAAQNKSVSISSHIIDKTSKTNVPFVNIVLKNAKTETFTSGVISDENGHFTFSNITSGNYILEISSVEFKPKKQSLFVGTLPDFLDLSKIEIEEDINTLAEVVVTAQAENQTSKIEKKIFSVADNITLKRRLLDLDTVINFKIK